MATTINNYTPSVVFHPGETLADKLEEMGMGVKEFAVRTSKPEKTIIAVIKGDSAITSDMSVAFETVSKIPSHSKSSSDSRGRNIIPTAYSPSPGKSIFSSSHFFLKNSCGI